MKVEYVPAKKIEAGDLLINKDGECYLVCSCQGGYQMIDLNQDYILTIRGSSPETIMHARGMEGFRVIKAEKVCIVIEE